MQPSTLKRRQRRRAESSEQVFRIDSVPWEGYEHLLKAFDERHIHITYDRGSVEIMTLSAEHERPKSIIALLMLALSDVFDVSMASLGSITNRRKDLQRGLEPDQCYYTKNLERIRGKKRLDLRRDPPPDLAIEIDVTSSSLDRMSIYAALGVPEVWRLVKGALHVHVLGKDGQYVERDRSPTFPAILISDLTPFIKMGLLEDDKTTYRAFREWLLEQVPDTEP